MESERAANPFLRTTVGSIAEAASQQAGQTLTTPVAVFAALRKWKDSF
jgi:hydroxyacylglutathione hydrolase